MPRERPPSIEPIGPAAVDALRVRTSAELDPQRRRDLGQFMTPSPIAAFMVGLFDRKERDDVRLLDAGAGVGSLTAAFLDAWLARAPRSARAFAVAYELDPILQRRLGETLAAYAGAAAGEGRALTTRIVAHDFLAAGADDLRRRRGTRFTHAILNPPYKKLGSASAARRRLREVGIEAVNLYSAFLALAIALMEDHGELVAIVPRSFCNGAYYRPFRAWMRERAALTRLHLFERRDHAFKDDDVLQENVIVKWIRGAPQGEVTVSCSEDATFTGLRERRHPFAAIVRPGDPEGFIHVPTGDDAGEGRALARFTCSLDELGVTVSTGPVVDFRLKAHLRPEPGPGAVPLLYPQHFAGGGLRYPGGGRKPSAIALNDETRRWLLPRGCYVVTRRFTSKEERRRVVAHVIDPAAIPGPWIGLENHLNVFHAGKQGLDPDLAHGLALFLNSTAVDDDFRIFSGHTQVNATDLRSLRYPTCAQLRAGGCWARGRGPLSQAEIDGWIERGADEARVSRATSPR